VYIGDAADGEEEAKRLWWHGLGCHKAPYGTWQGGAVAMLVEETTCNLKRSCSCCFDEGAWCGRSRFSCVQVENLGMVRQR
jgi:hypothetical protein